MMPIAAFLTYFLLLSRQFDIALKFTSCLYEESNFGSASSADLMITVFLSFSLQSLLFFSKFLWRWFLRAGDLRRIFLTAWQTTSQFFHLFFGYCGKRAPRCQSLPAVAQFLQPHGTWMKHIMSSSCFTAAPKPTLFVGCFKKHLRLC